MSETLISFSGVTFRYQGQATDLFAGLCLDIPEGSITAILGPNGSGKTTLLHLILGLLAPNDGVVCLAKRPRQHYSRHEMGKLVGLVSQDEYIPFNFTVRDYVLLGRAPHLAMLQMPDREDLTHAEQALERVGAQQFANRAIQSLSGGERQLVMLARALAQQPRILLLDEPTSHLDLSNKQHTKNVLKGLAADGVTIVFSTHEPNLAANIADTIAMMKEGAVIAAGDTVNVLTVQNLRVTYGVDVNIVEHDGRLVVI